MSFYVWLIRFVVFFGFLCLARFANAGLPAAPVLKIEGLDDQLLRSPAQFMATAPDVGIDNLVLADFRPLTSKDVNQGITDQAFWLRFRLQNSSDQALRWVIHNETTYLDTLSVYFADNGGERHRIHLSDREPFASRMLDYRALAFEHVTPSRGYTDVYLRLANIKADSVSLNMRLSSSEAFESRSRHEYAVFGLYYGAMAILIFLAVVVAWLLRQWVYFYYACFLLTSSLMWALLNGVAYQFLWPASVFWHNEGFHILYLLMTTSAFQFSRGFLQTRQHFPRIDRALRAGQVIMLGGIVLRFFGVYGPVLVLSFASLMTLLVLAPLGFLAYRRGQHFARWYAIAWVMYGIGLAISVLSAASARMPWGMEPLIFAQGAGVLEALLLLVALGERLLGWDRDRRLALRLANQDALTGLNNRRGLSLAYQSFRERYDRNRMPVFLALIDLDHFKAVNDSFGHEAGDRVLVELADLMRRTSRPEDVCIRFGGEEFAILLQAPSVHVAQEVVDRIREEFADNPTDYMGKTIPHTLTAGLVTVFSRSVYLTPQEMIRSADLALYEAKNAGRNKCLVFGEFA